MIEVKLYLFLILFVELSHRSDSEGSDTGSSDDERSSRYHKGFKVNVTGDNRIFKIGI